MSLRSVTSRIRRAIGQIAQRVDGTQQPATPRRVETWHELVQRTYLSFDRRTLGLTRICLGFFLVMDLFRRSFAWEAMFSDRGVLPTTTILARPQAGNYSILHAFSSPFELWVLFAVMLVTYVSLLIGFKTKLAQILSLVWVVSMNGRVLLIENGGYVVQNLLLLWTCFLPLGDRFSLDALLESLRRRREIGASDLNDRRALVPPHRLAPFVTLVALAVCFQLGILYYFNVVHKTGPAWNLRNATAVHSVMYVDRMVNPGPAALRDLVPFFVYRAMGRAVIVAEASIPFLLFTPIFQKWSRRLALVLVNFLHIGFGSTFVLGPFAWSLCVFSTLFFGPADWDDATRVLAREKRRRTVLYDPTSGAARLFSRVVARLDRFGLVGFVEADAQERAPGVLVERPDGSQIAGHRALSEIVQALPACAHFGLLLRLPLVRHAIDRSMRRGRWSRWLGLPSTEQLRTAGPDGASADVPGVLFATAVAAMTALAFFAIMGHQLVTASTALGRAVVLLVTVGVIVFAHARWSSIRGSRAGAVTARRRWIFTALGCVVVAAALASFGLLAWFVAGHATRTAGRIFAVATAAGAVLFFASKWWRSDEVVRATLAETRVAWFWGTVRELLVTACLLAAMNQALTELWATRKRWSDFITWLNADARVKQVAGTLSPQPDPLRYLAHKARFLQGWFMFSPNPVSDDATLVVDAITVDGRHVDPFWGTTPSFDLLHAQSFGYDQIWSDYFNRIQMGQNRAYRDDAVAYMRRLPERTGNANDALVSGEVYWVHDSNPRWGSRASFGESRNLIFVFGTTGGAHDPPKQPEKPGVMDKAPSEAEALPD